MKKIQKKLHLSDEGFSLMELIITMLVSAIVTAAAAGFLVAGVQFYNRANAETTVQKESQVAELFLTELMQESVNYEVITSCPAGVQYALKVTRKGAGGNDEVSMVIWRDDGQLWYGVVSNTATDDIERINEVLSKEKQGAFLADGLVYFLVDPGVRQDAIDGNGLVKIIMTFEELDKTYSSTATVSLRNKKKN